MVHRTKSAGIRLLVLTTSISLGVLAAQSTAAELISVPHTAGTGANGNSFTPSVSADGRFVAFRSSASNLVATDANGATLDIFVRDLATGSTALVSVPGDGSSGANGDSFMPAISADGRYLAFSSTATNLGSGDPNGSTSDVFLRDRVGNTTARVSVAADGAGGGNASSFWAAISGDGRFVAFQSEASNLVANDTNGSTADIFVRDLAIGVTTLVSVAADGVSGGNGRSAKPSISADGRWVAFESAATNLVASDPNGAAQDVFVRDLLVGTTTRVSVAMDDTNGADGWSYDPTLSGDGQVMAFRSYATNLVVDDMNGPTADIFIRDLQSAQTTLATVVEGGANADSFGPSLSADGRYVAFQSNASNLVDLDPNGAVSDIFVRDRVLGQTILVSTSADGFGGANGDSAWPSISTDGHKIAFSSSASNLVAGDINENVSDIFLATQSLVILRDGFEPAAASGR